MFSEIGWEKRGKQEEVLPPIYHERPTVITLPPTAPKSQVKFTKKKFFVGWKMSLVILKGEMPRYSSSSMVYGEALRA